MAEYTDLQIQTARDALHFIKALYEELIDVNDKTRKEEPDERGMLSLHISTFFSDLEAIAPGKACEKKTLDSIWDTHERLADAIDHCASTPKELVDKCVEAKALVHDVIVFLQ